MLLQQLPCPIEKEVFKFLWKIYVQQPSEENKEQSEGIREMNRAALKLLTYCAKVHASILEDKKRALMEHTIRTAQNPDIDWLLFKEEINAFQKTIGTVEQEDVAFLNSIIKILIKNRFCPRKMDWFCAAEETINAIFGLLDYPERHSEYMLHELSRAFINNSTDIPSEAKSTPPSSIYIN